MQDQEKQPASLAVNPSEVLEMLGGVSESTLRRLVAQGKFPAPITIGHSRIWPRAALKEWLEREWQKAVEASADVAQSGS